MKVQEDAKLRAQVAEEESEQHCECRARHSESAFARGGKLILFGNGGSATDANDWAIDCVSPPAGLQPVPAISLSLEPANITALANDVGTEVIFLRQLIAQARPDDVAIGISTSGGSRNIIMALEEARKRELLTVALLGYDGGEILRRGLADHPLVVRSDYIPRIQEVQASIYHIDSRASGGAWPCRRLELYGTASCPYTQELREWLDWNGARLRGIRRGSRRRGSEAHARCSRAASARCRCWSRMARWCRSAGRAGAAS